MNSILTKNNVAFETPILLLIFNRPDETKQVFEVLEKLKPKTLYIAADGPRVDKLYENKICQKVRRIALNITWPCKVKTLFRDENLGCGKAVSTGISWFFEDVEQGIILEDDTVPDLTFFTFCENMLSKYHGNENVMHISGSYFLGNYEKFPIPESYYFSKHTHVWGWATWKRAWAKYDYQMGAWNSTDAPRNLRRYYGSYFDFWRNIYTSVYRKEIDTWDYQWMFAIYRSHGITINPSKNLVKNIGFGVNATHTKDVKSNFSTVKLSSLQELAHPQRITVNNYNDQLYYKHFLHFEPNENSIKYFLCELKIFLKDCLKRLLRVKR